MTDINNHIILCPNCKASMTVDALGEHVSANPETKTKPQKKNLNYGAMYMTETI